MQDQLLRILLAPFSILYGAGVSLRNFFYDRGLLKSIAFDIPTISVGNLTVGGAGKTPHIEYLIRLLQDYLQIATLSRGYRRKTKGFLVANEKSDANIIGDEPLMFKRKFPQATVAVCESRMFAVPQIMMSNPQTQVILLDDAFQHRPIEPGLNILLTEYSKPFTKDFLLPYGRLREWRSSASRADIIIVSKCPPVMTLEDKERLRKEIPLLPHQKLFFSYYEYNTPYYLFDKEVQLPLTEDLDVLLLCAIARTDYLLQHLDQEVGFARVMEFTDHHYFSKGDLAQALLVFEQLEGQQKIILTTEKDAMRLELHKEYLLEKKMPVFVLPVQVKFHFEEGEIFDDAVRQFLLNFKV